MPGIPLLNLGYGLGGLVQGYQNQQNQGLQQALQRLQLQQAQSQQNAQGLAALALQAGLLNNPTQINPLSPINVSAPQTAPAAPQPAAPIAPQQTPAPQQSFTPPSPYSLDDTRSATVDQPPIYGPGPGQPDTSAVPDPDTSPQQPQQQPAPAPAPAPSQNGDTSSRSDSSSAPSPGGGGGGGVAAVFPNGQSIDISSMFKTIDYQKLAQGIAQLAPRGTSQADIYAAVLDLGKLAEGDKVQQQQAGLIARTLLGGQFKLAATGMADTSRESIAAGHDVAAGQRTAATTASREKIAQEQIAARQEIAAASQQLRRDAQNIRNANDQARIAQSAQRIAISAQNAGRADIALQIQSISRRISTIKPQADGSYTDQQQQQLKAFSDQIATLAAQAAQGTSETGP